MGTIKRTFANSLTGTGKLSATNLDSNIPAANIADASVTNVTALSPSLGSAIPSVASDPPSPTLGDIWYNSSTGKLKNYGFTAAAWASGGNLGTGRYVAGATGDTSAGLYAGGIASGSPETSLVEEYNGTSWSEVNDLPETRWSFSMTGPQTAAVAAGGYSAPLGGLTNTSKEYDGTNWTSGGNMNTARRNVNSCGTQTAALAASGIISPSVYSNASEEYDGSAWTSGNPINTTRQNGFMIGTIPNAFIAGGSSVPTPGGLTNHENYDGTSWTESATDLVTSGLGSNGGGTVTSAIVAQGGAQGNTGSQTFDGTAWATSATLATDKAARSGGGTTQNNSYVAGGGPVPSGASTATEEFTAAPTTRTFTTS